MRGQTLSAVSRALVGDVTYVVRIDTVGSAPLVIDWSNLAKPPFDRTFGLRPRISEFSPAKLVPQIAAHVALRCLPLDRVPWPGQGNPDFLPSTLTDHPE